MRRAVAPASGSLGRSLQRTTGGSGKRLRPILVIAAAASQGTAIDARVLRAAAAIELAHLATLVHDDIMDQAAIRWGLPTISSREGPNHAIVVGDYLLAIAIAEAISVSQDIGRELAATIAIVCDGQSRETADDYNPNRAIASYNQAIHDKTATLLAAACKIGGQCAALPAKQVAALGNYGEAFGMAFQLVDDVLDFTSDTKTMGKPVGNDAKTGVYTLPLLLALRGSGAKKIRPWLGKAPLQPLSTRKLRTVLEECGALDQTVQTAQEQAKAAESALQSLPKTSVVHGLQQLPSRYLAEALQKQT